MLSYERRQSDDLSEIGKERVGGSGRTEKFIDLVL